MQTVKVRTYSERRWNCGDVYVCMYVHEGFALYVGFVGIHVNCGDMFIYMSIIALSVVLGNTCNWKSGTFYEPITKLTECCYFITGYARYSCRLYRGKHICCTGPSKFGNF